MPEKISISKESGETLSSNIVSVFMIPDTEKKYIITTENAVDPHGLTVLHVSEIVDGTLQKIATDDEWSSIKTIMRAIISGNVGSYQYLPTIDSIKASGQYSRDISVSASASKQMIDNYAVGEKSAINMNALTNVPAAASNTAPSVGQVTAQTPPVTSIFPTNGSVNNSDDEVVPGIAEVADTPSVVEPINNAVIPPVIPDAGIGSVPPVVNPVPSPVANTEALVPNVGVTAGVAAIPPVGPVGATPVAPVAVNDTVAPSVPPVLPDNNTGVPPVVSPTPVANVAPVVSPVPVVAEQPVVQQPVQEIAPVVPVVPEVKPDVQIVEPTQVVPTAQIAQDAQAASNIAEIKFDTNAQPSFAPNATLDEVVAGAQEMFMEGVKNLVQTIQEKVYRELYNKEAELKEKEAMLLEKERMINEQTMAMNNAGIASAPAVTAVSPVQPVVQQPLVQPTVVQAANDVI